MPEFEPGEEVCARIVAFDVAGHRSAPSPETCSTAISCPLVFNQFCSLPTDCSAGSEPTGMNDAGPDAAEPDADPIDAVSDGVGADATEVDTQTPPTHEPDAGGPVTPGDGGCSVSRHDPASSSARPLFAAMLVAVSFLRRWRRTVSG